MIKIICDGAECQNSFADLYPGDCPVGWVRVEAFAPGRRTIGHMCPNCWNKNPINFAKNRPWLLDGLPAKHPSEEDFVSAWDNRTRYA
jgi:hypothetical protein